MNNKYNVCVIGTGHIANKFHIPSFKKNKKSLRSKIFSLYFWNKYRIYRYINNIRKKAN